MHSALRYVILALSSCAATLAGYACIVLGGFPRESAFMAAILVLAALLWVTEALPLFATALLVLGLEIVLLANPGGWSGFGFESGSSPDYRTIVAAAADPVLMLFFGGLLMAQAAVKQGVDRSMSSLLLRPFGEAPAVALAGVMAVTALFSMFMSNTATASMMLALVAPALGRMAHEEPFRRALILGVAFAANIGGMATPIGSPPNAVAMGHLRAAGLQPSFLEWVLVAAPIAALCLAIAWISLLKIHPPSGAAVRVRVEPGTIGPRGIFVVAIFVLTVLLWLADRWHGLPASVIALIPAIAFTATRTLTAEDLGQIDWSVLILIGGGIALGAGMAITGLDRLIVQWLPIDAGGRIWLIGVMVCAALTLSVFMSNTAAANLLLPIGVSAATAFEDATVLREVAVGIALAAALAMALPVSTPPNALAYSRGGFSVKAMLLPGALIGVVGAALVTVAVGALIRLWSLSA
jgi:sodium-dependent dicarboxylate transporter 2/3/5